MSSGKGTTRTTDAQTELIRTLVIIQLGLAGVPQQRIRSIAKCNMNRVSRILKNVKPKKAIPTV
jgi:hypothetical protein